MPVYAYRALNVQRTAVDGTIAADSPRSARDVLRARGLVVHAIGEHAAVARPAFSRRCPSNRHAAQLTTAVREIATLLGAGISLLDALNTISEQQRGELRSALLLVRDRVSAGVGLAEAMTEQPHIFDSLCIHMTEVGESSGALETVFDQWADFKDRSLALKDRVITALTYPAFVLMVGIAVVLFLMTFVIPTLMENLVEAGRPLPWATQVVKGLSDFLVAYGWLLGIAAAVLLASLGTASRAASGRRLWWKVLMHVPLIGGMAQKQAIARIALVIATLMKSGVEFLRALEVTGRSFENTPVGDALAQIGREVGAGQEIGRALDRTGIFPAMAVRIFTVGQESGRLEEMLERLAADYDRQVARAAERLTTALEPILILTLAFFVGFVLLATILPILEAGNVAQT